MAKRPAAKAAVVKKTTKRATPAIKPVKQAMTKSALINLIAEENEIPRKTAAGVYSTLENVFLGSVHPRGLGEFTLPGLLKVNLRKVPARKAGTLVRNPATGEMIKGAAKPASVRVKIRALSKLKTSRGVLTWLESRGAARRQGGGKFTAPARWRASPTTALVPLLRKPKCTSRLGTRCKRSWLRASPPSRPP